MGGLKDLLTIPPAIAFCSVHLCRFGYNKRQFDKTCDMDIVVDVGYFYYNLVMRFFMFLLMIYGSRGFHVLFSFGFPLFWGMV